ncbi:hypothetical protein C8J57DRAFT_1718468 [Mycena rebaudengoi]|nr:hypothetical protein C8J57DRAFT_1718468 [Mycena rebaudengoi]
MAGMVAFIIQSFYAYRIYLFSNTCTAFPGHRGKGNAVIWFTPAVIVVVSLTSFIGAFLSGVTTFKVGDLKLLNTRTNYATYGVWWGASALSDVMIAVCMTYYLSTHDTVFRKTRALLSKLIRLTIETGSLTATMAFVFYLAFPGMYYTIPTLVLPKLYANSMMVVLNTRFQILGGRGTDISSMDFISAPSFAHDNTRPDAAGGTGSASHRVTFNAGRLSDGGSPADIEMKRLSKSPELGTAA